MDVNGTKMSTRKVNVWRSEKWSNCINEPMKPNDWTFEWCPSLGDECSTNPAGRVDELASGSICESNPHFGAFRSFSLDFESLVTDTVQRKAEDVVRGKIEERLLIIIMYKKNGKY